VSEDIPAITGDLREAAASATDAFGEVEDTVGALGPSLRGFAADGLPQYARLAAEARTLVQNLEQLVRTIERDPARYFLGGEAPVFRR
jgi:phospholipid/cholesterol/gamma-HCH transport system substrate-binding protein